MRIPNTFQIEADCERLIEFSSTKELMSLLPVIQQAKKNDSLIIIGRGSNLLPTKDYAGTVVRSRIMGREILPGNIIRIGSGETVDDIIQWTIDNKLYGMENLSLIPGEVGASAVQNVGAYGVEAKDIIKSIEAIEIETGKCVTINNEDCAYAYRQSKFKNEWKGRYIITYVTYQLSDMFTSHLDYGNIRQSLTDKGIEMPTAQQLRDTIIEIRNAKLPDPDVEGNGGSFFMNPIVSKDKYLALASKYPNMPHYKVDDEREKIPAGWMIDQCGWKGRCLGKAGVHDKQALVLVNKGGAKGEEIVALCRMIQKDVLEKFGIEIHPEVNFI